MAAVFESRDYVVHAFMPHPTGIQPAAGSAEVTASTELRWDPIPGAKYYEVFLRNDREGTEATPSGVRSEPRFIPPRGSLQSGGEYVWRIHAGDSDGNALLRDFNHGSLSPEIRFTVK